MKIPKLVPNPRIPKYISLPSFIKSLAVLILEEEYCYNEIIEDLNFYNVDCLKYGLSKGLGIGIVIGGCIVKVPQLSNIFKSKSTKGVSTSSYLLESIAYLIIIVYNQIEKNPFSTWGEALCILIQNLIVLFFMGYYNQAIKFGIMLTLPMIFIYLIMLLFSKSIMAFLFFLTIPIILISRIPQIYLILQTKSIGQLSFPTTVFYCLGTAARVFTTFQEIKDRLILAGNVFAFLVNFVLLALVIYYRDTKVKSHYI